MSSSSLPPNPDPVLNVSITPELIEKHGLQPEEYDHIVQTLGREPTLTELGIFSVMWSEHCSYKNSKPLLKTFPVEKKDTSRGYGRVMVKAGEENAGVIDIGGGWAICFKIESHNHPSAVEPFEGAATGVGGIIRDIFTMGARPVLLTNSLRFGDLEDATVKRLFRGVVAGISHYGNCMGIPTVGGDVVFDESYEGNPLVNALCLGILRHDQLQKGAATGVGNPVYYVGAATGRDGLGGASFASRELTEESQADRPAVQKGDPFMEKLLLEACLEMMAIPGLVVGIQDMGAAGLTCSTCETAGRGNAGIEIELDEVPQRETNMNSYEIMLSESQERMLVIVQKGREKEIEDVFAKWDLHAAKVGEVKEGDRMVVKQHGVTVADLPARFLTDEGPVYEREAKEPAYLAKTQAWKPDEIADLTKESLAEALPGLLGDPSIASKEWVYRQYDHMVGASTVVLPGSDAAVCRIRTGEGDKFVAIANDGIGRYCYLDPHRGGLIAMAECLRNLACSGAEPLAMTDNLNFGNPYKPEVFYTMKEAVKGLSDCCAAFDVPVVGGNVSLYNENHRGAIDPTPVISVVGLIEKEADITTQTVSAAGQKLLLLGGWPDEIGGSQYLQTVHSVKTGRAPEIDLAKEKTVHDLVRQVIREGRVKAAHDLSDGGLLVAVGEMLFAEEQNFGATLELASASPARWDALLFGESQGRILLAVDSAEEETVIATAQAAGVAVQSLGKVTAEPILSLRTGGSLDHSWEVKNLRDIWSQRIGKAMALPGLPS
ncbi:MAG: phosphoribosylformylglycinamidine synthase subunit PurL [Opitutales bacterium]|nr:phosphoribosylformylglycinamidine synthase subunit PurL [Opitutales bacterium]